MTKKIPKLSDEDIEILSEHIAEVIWWIQDSGYRGIAPPGQSWSDDCPI
jgi:hypothetical protein